MLRGYDTPQLYREDTLERIRLVREANDRARRMNDHQEAARVTKIRHSLPSMPDSVIDEVFPLQVLNFISL
jgi:hypothetical protein